MLNHLLKMETLSDKAIDSKKKKNEIKMICNKAIAKQGQNPSLVN